MNNEFYDIAFNESMSFFTHELYCSAENKKLLVAQKNFFIKVS